MSSPKPKAVHDIGIVIVNYNVRHFLIQCIQSIKNSRLNDLSIEVWVVDNASVDGSVQLLQKDFPEINLIINNQNKGFSTANNQAIKKLNSKYTLLLNPDTILEEDTLKMCFDFMESRPDTGALGVRMIDGSGKFLPESKRKVPDLWNSFCKLSFLSDIFPTSRLFSGYNLGYLPEHETNEIEVLCGAFMFIRSSVLSDTGLLDEAFFMYGEDIDLSYRIIQAGHKIYYFPETSIIHYKGESTKKSSLNYVRTFYGAMHIYVNKHYSKGNADVFSFLIKMAISFRAFISASSRIVSNWLLPMIDILLIWVVLSQAKYVWASYYFDNIHYYDNTNIDSILLVYSVVWTFFLWLSGHYERLKSFVSIISGVATGTAIILVCYALLPEYLRTSRVLILLGTLTMVFISALTGFVKLLLTNRSKKGVVEATKNMVIVAEKDSAEKLLLTIKNANVNFENVYIVTPNNEDIDDAYYTNTLSFLPKVVNDLKIDEVIFSNENMTMKEIIKSMTTLDRSVSFKIGGDDSLSIIGSNSRNSQGQFYNLDITYKLHDDRYKRYKSLFDFVVSMLILCFFPFVLLLNNGSVNVFKNLFLVTIGQKTWVGYGGDQSDYGFLPSLKSAVIKYPLATKQLLYSDDHFKKMNIDYAKNYSIFTDLEIVWRNLYKVGNK
jgi:O-antigen biosynthesis protein